MKKVFLLSLLAFSVFSCSSSDDDGEKPQEVVKLVKSIEYAGDLATDFFLFEYDDQDRVSKISSASEIAEYQYEGNRIICAEKILSYHNDGYVTTYVLDNNGYLKEQITVPYGGENVAELTYQNGYLYQATDKYGAITYTWENDNIKQYASERTTVTFDYGTMEDKLNINLDRWLTDADSGYAFGFKFKGIANKNYPTRLTIQGGYNYSATYNYTFDKDGYPTEIVTIYGGGWSGLRDTMKITYY